MIVSRVFIFVLIPLEVSLLLSDSNAEIPKTIADPMNNLQVYALPIGQGDCTIIQCPNGNIVVFDCGSRTAEKYGWSANKVREFLGDNIYKVVAIVVSHADDDHSNYLPRIFDNDLFFISNKEVIFAGDKDAYSDSMQEWFEKWENLPRTNKLYTIGTMGWPYSECIGDCVVSRDGSTNFCRTDQIQFEILAANVGDLNKPNEQSIVMKIIDGDWSMLLPGDMEGDASKEIASKLGDRLESNVYKIAHHGASNSANLLQWLVPIKPQSAFISSAYGYYYHPRCDAIARLLLVGRITTTNVVPHNFYCGNSGGYLHNYFNGFKYNMWETSPTKNQICYLKYSSGSIFPEKECNPPDRGDNDDNDGDNNDDDNQCVLPDREDNDDNDGNDSYDGKQCDPWRE